MSVRFFLSHIILAAWTFNWSHFHGFLACPVSGYTRHFYGYITWKASLVM